MPNLLLGEFYPICVIGYIYIYSYCLCTILSCMHYWFVLSLKATVFITTVSFVTSFLCDERSRVYIELERVSCIL